MKNIFYQHQPSPTPTQNYEKYKLGIIATTQYTDQMSPEEVKSMLGNVGTFICLRSSSLDADRFSKQIGHFKPHQYIDLKRGEAFFRIICDGSPVSPFRGFTDIDYIKPHFYSEQIIRFVRKTYTYPREEVEQAYMRWIRKLVIDPEERRKQRQQIAKKKEEASRLVLSHQPVTDTGSISERGQNAKAKIRKIAEDAARKHQTKQPRYPVFKKPTRRRRRNHLSNN